jgi:hypothetical protein
VEGLGMEGYERMMMVIEVIGFEWFEVIIDKNLN